MAMNEQDVVDVLEGQIAELRFALMSVEKQLNQRLSILEAQFRETMLERPGAPGRAHGRPK